MLITAIFTIMGYLLGSVNSAILVCKAFGLPDPRLEGSKNPGTTNVLRVGGKVPALIVLVLDVLKGIVPVLLAKILACPALAVGLIALATVLGHIYPLYFRFQGGKGVATQIGALLAISLGLGLAFVIVWLVVAFALRYSSLAALVATLCTPFVAGFFIDGAYFIPLAAMGGIIFYRHRGNIQRLINKTEPKIGNKKK